MPDPYLKTVSATQVPALFNQSPYCTRWMLYQYFKGNMPLDVEEDVRMSAGKFMEPAILAWAAAQLRLDVVPNSTYVRHAGLRIGCTQDSDVVDPALGPGVVEAKNVDGWIWRSQWSEEYAPPHIEIQLQVQMMVKQAAWGCIAALVGGNDLKLYRRLPNIGLQQSIAGAVETFFDDLAADRVPDPLGAAIEVPGILFLYPEVTVGKIITSTDLDAGDLAFEYQDLSARRLALEKLEKDAKAKLLGMAQDAEILNVPGFEVVMKKTPIAESQSVRKAHTKTTMKFRKVDL